MSDQLDPSLTPQQDQAVVALLSEPTIRKAAETAGVNERTIYRWLEEPAFAAAYRRAKLQAFRQSTALIQKAMPLAVQVLVKVASDVSTPPSAKVSASSALLKHGRESIEMDDMAARLESLERAMKGAK